MGEVSQKELQMTDLTSHHPICFSHLVNFCSQLCSDITSIYTFFNPPTHSLPNSSSHTIHKHTHTHTFYLPSHINSFLQIWIYTSNGYKRHRDNHIIKSPFNLVPSSILSECKSLHLQFAEFDCSVKKQ